MSLTQRTKSLLKKYSAKPVKALGQNFLINQHILEKIVAATDIHENDFVIEIGPGLGFLTALLAKKTKNVLAVELDRKMVEILTQELPHAHVVHGDALKINWREKLEALGWQGEKLKVIANLPYYITTPILFMFLEGDLPVSEMVVMMQKEVAERIAAKPGGKIYGALSVAVQYRCEVLQVCKVASNAFLPQPDIESAVIKLVFHTVKPHLPKDEKLLFKIVRGAFAQRRKTLHNTITNVLPDIKDEVDEAMLSVDIIPSRRGETLSVKEFVALADAIYAKLH